MPNNLVYKRGSDGFFKISHPVLELMMGFAQNDDKPESGGVLLGRHILNTGSIVVDHITTPAPEDIQTRYRFFRSQHIHQKIIDQRWLESNETCTYLGEWHTHPEPVPSPSFTDKCNWRRKLMFDRFSQHIFFVIIGTEAVRVWEGHIRRLSLFELEVFE